MTFPIRTVGVLLVVMVAGSALRSQTSLNTVPVVKRPKGLGTHKTRTPRVTTTDGITLPKYKACLDLILSGGDAKALDCPLRSFPKKQLLYIVVGDSTARKEAQGVNPNFPEFKFNGSQESVPCEITENIAVGGKLLNVTVALERVLRHHDLHEEAVTYMRSAVQKYGVEPAVIVFSGMALHECRRPDRNEDPLWREVLNHKTGQLQWPESGRQKYSKAAAQLSIGGYLKMQEPCTIAVLKQLRLEYPNTLMVWRSLLPPAVLFKGSHLDKEGKLLCTKRMQAWSEDKWTTCTRSYEQHQRLAAELREIGFGVLHDGAMFPKLCGSYDAIHLGADCHKVFAKWVLEASRLPVPNPSSFMKKDEVLADQKVQCSAATKRKAIEAMNVLTLSELRSHRVTRRLTAHCAKVLGFTRAYDPELDEYFPVTPGTGTVEQPQKGGVNK